MSKCWYCNEELTTANYYDKHIGICTKCYNSMFKVSNEFVKGLMDKISDLEAKLAESEKERELDNSFWEQECDSLQNTLAEKEKEIESLKDNWNVLCDYLGDCVVKYDEEDVNGIYGEVLDKVNILRRYDYKRHQDKTNFAIEKLEKVKEYIKNNSMLMNAESLDDSDLGSNYSAFFVFSNDIIDELDNQIKKLNGGK